VCMPCRTWVAPPCCAQRLSTERGWLAVQARQEGEGGEGKGGVHSTQCLLRFGSACQCFRSKLPMILPVVFSMPGGKIWFIRLTRMGELRPAFGGKHVFYDTCGNDDDLVLDQLAGLLLTALLAYLHLSPLFSLTTVRAILGSSPSGEYVSACWPATRTFGVWNRTLSGEWQEVDAGIGVDLAWHATK
jgi:hypothetical protein